MNALANSGHRAVAIEDFAAWRAGERSLPEGAFVLTFDDGFAGVHDHAAPALAALGWPATVFLVAAKLGGHSDWAVTTRYPMRPHPLMDAGQARALRTQGFSLQSHSLLHRDLTTLDAKALLEDLHAARELIAATTGEFPHSLAYPYGRYDERIVRAALEAGYGLGLTVDSGFNRRGCDPLRIRRLDVFGSDTARMLVRKIRLGTNDGSLKHLMHYYVHRTLRRG
jgi:peptidoglycan/xylan/chitin deacetylase (PgdA/CDA1 family)